MAASSRKRPAAKRRQRRHGGADAARGGIVRETLLRLLVGGDSDTVKVQAARALMALDGFASGDDDEAERTALQNAAIEEAQALMAELEARLGAMAGGNDLAGEVSELDTMGI